MTYHIGGFYSFPYVPDFLFWQGARATDRRNSYSTHLYVLLAVIPENPLRGKILPPNRYGMFYKLACDSFRTIAQ